MGFFSLLETFFFLSLGVTFVLIIMLVYHFKGRLVVIEDKYHTMFEIMNSMVKEMRNLREIVAAIPPPLPPQVLPVPPSTSMDGAGFAPGGLGDLLRLFQGAPFPSGGNGMFGGEDGKDYDDDEEDEEDGEDEDEDDDDEAIKKIVVSDTELESDDEAEDVKIISIDMGETDSTPLADLEDNLLDQLEVEPAEEKESVSNTTDFRKMDVSYLRTLVLARGLAMDTKKMKKSDLVRLLEQSTDGEEILGSVESE